MNDILTEGYRIVKNCVTEKDCWVAYTWAVIAMQQFQPWTDEHLACMQIREDAANAFLDFELMRLDGGASEGLVH